MNATECSNNVQRIVILRAVTSPLRISAPGQEDYSYENDVNVSFMSLAIICESCRTGDAESGGKCGVDKFRRRSMSHLIVIIGSLPQIRQYKQSRDSDALWKTTRVHYYPLLNAPIQACIASGSIIISDMWAPYQGIETMIDMNYTHETVNHTENIVDPMPGAHTQTIESLWHVYKMQNKRQ
ncbi:hypothetical protein CLF_100547 [Clonorchis sinensis]|uniref:Uncharacterized protein n=1 Tax=Clonorchis sinensis TaxID=79923 RepID=H2KNP8_CLOSI|nr:hypothetical protein CLF_100547 [Clonorchis sinensis]